MTLLDPTPIDQNLADSPDDVPVEGPCHIVDCPESAAHLMDVYVARGLAARIGLCVAHYAYVAPKAALVSYDQDNPDSGHISADEAMAMAAMEEDAALDRDPRIMGPGQ